MAYVKTNWENRIVERPKTFRQQQNADGTITLTPEEGSVIKEGTPVNASNMNKIENEIVVVGSQFEHIVQIQLPKKASKDGSLQVNLNAEKLGGKTLSDISLKSGTLGDVKQFAISPNSTWKFCDGSRVLKSNYLELYNFLGMPTETPILKDFIARDSKISSVSRMVYGNGIYVATNLAKVATSTDGINWIARQSFSASVDYLVFGNGVFVVELTGRKILTSTDGITWVANATVDTSWGSVGLIFDGTKFISIARCFFQYPSTCNIRTSTDGRNWTIVSTWIGSGDSLVYGNGIYSFVQSIGSNYTPSIIISTDLITWTTITTGISLYNTVIMRFFDNKFMIGTPNGDYSMTTDFRTFTKITGLPVGVYSNFLNVGNKILLATQTEFYTVDSIVATVTPVKQTVSNVNGLANFLFVDGLILGWGTSFATSWYYNNSEFQLPVIQNVYIKAKEV